MKIKLAAFDFDGTLIDDKQVMSDFTRETLLRLEQAGVQVVLVTGRIYATIRRRARALNVKLPVISCNGAYIRDEEKVYRAWTLTNEEIRPAIEILEQNGCYYHVFANNRIVSTNQRFMPRLFRTWEIELPVERDETLVHFDSVEQILDFAGDGVLKILAVEPDMEKCRRVREQLLALDRYGISSSFDDNIEILKRGVTKGKALRELAESLGVSREQVMAVGDGENDISMLTYAGVGVAMGNAGEDVKRAADFVTDSNREDGAAKAIRRFCFGEE